jgi:nicotinate-nucleotide adenylyltransferase
VTTHSRIGVFGGSFDPVHTGHLIMATELRFALKLDVVLFVPAGRPPHKPDMHITDDHHRLAMLKLALDGAPRFRIHTVDLDRAGPSYTVDTLAILRRELDPAQLVFLMGADSLRDLPTWHDPNRIAAQAELGVARRPGVALDLTAIERAIPAARGRVHLVDIPEIQISSSDLRCRVAAGQPIAYQVPRPVEDYIVSARLYLDEPEVSDQ